MPETYPEMVGVLPDTFRLQMSAELAQTLRLSLDRRALTQFCGQVAIPLESMAQLQIIFTDQRVGKVQDMSRVRRGMQTVAYGTFAVYVDMTHDMPSERGLVAIDVPAIEQVTAAGVILPDFSWRRPSPDADRAIFDRNMSSVLVHELFHFRDYLDVKRQAEQPTTRVNQFQKLLPRRHGPEAITHTTPMDNEFGVRQATKEYFANHHTVDKLVRSRPAP